MNDHQYIGLDVHKKWIWFCAKNREGDILEEGKFLATQAAIEQWCLRRTTPWTGLMEATIFSHWIYDVLAAHADQIRMGHPASMKEALSVKHKNDRNDARRFADFCRNDMVRTLYVMPKQLRGLRRWLRIRRLLSNQIVRLKNRIAGLLLETGVEFQARRIHSKRHHEALLQSSDVPADIKPLLRMLHQLLMQLKETQRTIFSMLEQSADLKERIQLLQSIPAVGKIMALTWALEVGEIKRFASVSAAISYCGLVSAQNESAGKNKGGPLSQVRNRELQHMLIEVSHLAPQLYWKYEEIYRASCEKRHSNAAIVSVARKLVTYLVAVDRSGQAFQMQPAPEVAATAATAESFA
jgi:transposase